jgi:hypothetical protein
MSTRTYPLKVERWGQGGRACRQQGAPPPCPFLRRAIRLVAHGYRLDDPPDFWTREEACDMLADLGHDDVEQPPAAPQRAERVPAIAGHTVADLLGVDRDGRAQPPGAVPSATRATAASSVWPKARRANARPAAPAAPRRPPSAGPPAPVAPAPVAPAPASAATCATRGGQVAQQRQQPQRSAGQRREQAARRRTGTDRLVLLDGGGRVVAKAGRNGENPTHDEHSPPEPRSRSARQPW